MLSRSVVNTNMYILTYKINLDVQTPYKVKEYKLIEIVNKPFVTLVFQLISNYYYTWVYPKKYLSEI